MVAVDGSLSALEKARNRLNREGLSYTTAQCGLTALPFENGSFDVVIDIVSSCHNSMPDMHQIFGEVARVLKPGGKLFSMFPTPRCNRRRFHGLGIATFLERPEIDNMLGRSFQDIQILRSSYELTSDCLIDNWVVTGDRRP